MNLYKIETESQSRPVNASSDKLFERGSLVILKTGEIEQLGEIKGKMNFLLPCLKDGPYEILREATEEDIKIREEQRLIEKDAFAFCKRTSLELNLQMRLIKVHHYFDSSKMIFYYTADGRIDFRELVKILARTFRIRIEMRQVGVRDETKICGGVGHCGLKLCCSNHLNHFAPVSVRMAKEQGLTLNPSKISGVCGRLMCCLRYEIDADALTDAISEEENGVVLEKEVKDE